MSEPETPFWLAWIAPMLGLLTAIGFVVRNLFINAVRNVGEKNHLENQTRSREIEERVAEVEKNVAWIKGRIQDRWGD